MPTIKDVTIPTRLVAEYEDAKRCYQHAREQSSRFYTEYLDTVDKMSGIVAEARDEFWCRECVPRDKQRDEADSAAHHARVRLRLAENAILNVVAAACGFPPPPKEP